MGLLKVFKPLSLKQGYILRAYQFREGGNGNAVVWAMPIDSPFPEPNECPRLEDRFLEPPRPPEALDEVIDAVEGDDSPWSYFCVSLFLREVAEFGAMWHGCDWSTHKILGNPPRELRQREQDWRWLEDQPESWSPVFEKNGDERVVTFFTYSGFDKETIWLFTDRYATDCLRFTSERVPIAEGPMGFIF